MITRLPKSGVMIAALMALAATSAHAWHLEGRVFCEGTGLPLTDVTVQIVSTSGAPFSGSSSTNEAGFYHIDLPETPGCFVASLSLGPGATVIIPAAGELAFCTTDVTFEFIQNWVVSSPKCEEGRCWLTAGGAKFSAITGTRVGENGPDHSWGGNVNPGCSPTAGEGGQWNHVAHDLRLHFQGRAIEVIRCGNVDGIPPGSDSPETPFNFIDFQGTGTLKGIRGNKVDYGTVNFFAHCEDRNEPGSSGQRDGEFKDRYFLHVFDDDGNTLLLVDVDGDASTVDPVTITHGNMQIHISSCDFASTAPPVTLSRSAPTVQQEGAGSVSGELSMSASPNPTRSFAFVKFVLPSDADVSLAAFDVAGRVVRDLAAGRWAAGQHSVSWNLHDQQGRRVSNGVYYLRLTVNGQRLSRVVTIMP